MTNNFTLRQTAQTDIQTDFRFELYIEPNNDLGLTTGIVGYIQQTNLPHATGNPIVWSLPGGMRNHQAGKREVQPLQMTWVTATANRDSVLRMCEKWQKATYNLNDGTNIGKKRYCTDGIYIFLKSENNKVEYSYQLLCAQMTDVDPGTLNSESNDSLKIQCSIIYDNYILRQGISGAELVNTTI